MVRYLYKNKARDPLLLLLFFFFFFSTFNFWTCLGYVKLFPNKIVPLILGAGKEYRKVNKCGVLQPITFLALDEIPCYGIDC